MLKKIFLQATVAVCIAFAILAMYNLVVEIYDDFYHQGYINGQRDTGEEYLFKDTGK